ncbi:MAG: hypothetical protein FWF96_03135 [Kiritimatiellaeota bacterium]|nr:hypothetical protein [Kiritimatiellota bacterium]
MGGASFEGVVSGDGVDEGLHGGDGAGRDTMEVRALGKETPDMAVDVLDRALNLPFAFFSSLDNVMPPFSARWIVTQRAACLWR